MSGDKVNIAESRIMIMFIRLCLLIKRTAPVVQVMDPLSKGTSKIVDVKLCPIFEIIKSIKIPIALWIYTFCFHEWFFVILDLMLPIQ